MEDECPDDERADDERPDEAVDPVGGEPDVSGIGPDVTDRLSATGLDDLIARHRASLVALRRPSS